VSFVEERVCSRVMGIMCSRIMGTKGRVLPYHVWRKGCVAVSWGSCVVVSCVEERVCSRVMGIMCSRTMGTKGRV